MAIASGTKIGPYEVLAPLGAGGMGEVYRAKDTRLGRDVAIKILPKDMSADPERKQRFQREAKTISSLNHPNICTLHDIGSQDGLDYLVMECVEGETLAKRLEKGPLPLEEVLKYGVQIASALDMAHRNGVVHRDVKPGNVMLTRTGAKVLDFGLANFDHHGRPTSAHLTRRPACRNFRGRTLCYPVSHVPRCPCCCGSRNWPSPTLKLAHFFYASVAKGNVLHCDDGVRLWLRHERAPASSPTTFLGSPLGPAMWIPAFQNLPATTTAFQSSENLGFVLPGSRRKNLWLICSATSCPKRKPSTREWR